MLGITFVPVLIILFMVLAAIYDHWAVNGSKHMLELADTMIDLKLPVLRRPEGHQLHLPEAGRGHQRARNRGRRRLGRGRDDDGEAEEQGCLFMGIGTSYSRACW